MQLVQNKKQNQTKAKTYLPIMWLFYQITSLEAYGSQTQSTVREKREAHVLLQC